MLQCWCFPWISDRWMGSFLPRELLDNSSQKGLRFSPLLKARPAVKSDQVVQGLIRSGLEKRRVFYRTETAQLLWVSCCSAGLFSSWKCFSLYPVWTSLISIHAWWLLSYFYALLTLNQKFKPSYYVYSVFQRLCCEAQLKTFNRKALSRRKKHEFILSQMGMCDHTCKFLFQQ